MNHSDHIELNDRIELRFNDACQQDYGRKDEPTRKIANIVICGQCPYYEHIPSMSLCRGTQMTGYCIPNECLKAFIDDNDEVWALSPDMILEQVKTEIIKTVQ